MKSIISIWNRTKIVTLSRLLLVMMAGAGVFFTTAFLIIKSNTSAIQEQWQVLQHQTNSQISQSGVELEQMISHTNELIDWFIIAVLLAVAAFTLLMYFTLFRKIAHPLKAMEKGIDEITQSNQFEKQLTVKTTDEVGQVLSSFNQLTGNLKQTLDGTNETLGLVAQGQFKQKIDLQLSGDLEKFKNNVNASIQSVADTMDSLEQVIDGLHQGDFSVRMSDKVQGNLKHKVDNAMHTMDQIIDDVNAVMQQVNSCRFDKRVTVLAQGRLDELKLYINRAMDGLENGLGAMNIAIEKLSAKNLTHQIQGHYEGEMEVLKDRLNHTSSQLNSTMISVSGATVALDQGVSNIASENSSLAERTQKQAESIDQTATAMEQITASIQEMAQNAEDANQKSSDTQKLAQKGVAVMEQTVQSMQAIQEESMKISDIINLIDSIAFQTNLLALNAAVEAARAGEQGRGFAVVASEVRNLAQKSADSAKQIGDLINQVVTKVNTGAEQMNATHVVFNDIHNSIHTIDELVSNISHSTQEQSSGMLQMNQAITSLDTGIRENALMVQQTKEQSDSLVDLSHNLQSEVDKFLIK